MPEEAEKPVPHGPAPKKIDEPSITPSVAWSVTSGIRARQEAALRMPPLICGCRDVFSDRHLAGRCRFNADDQLAGFIADVTSRYPVEEILLFGSRARGDARPDSDWDIVVCLRADDHDGHNRRLLADTTLQRHFPTFLDLFTLAPDGTWDYPAWTADDDGYRGWFPGDAPYRYDIEASVTVVWPSGGAA